MKKPPWLHMRLAAALSLAVCCGAAAADPAAGSPAARFVVAGDGQTVTDTASGLIWQRAQSPTGRTWKGAYDYCNSLKIAGVGGWRLPTLKELQSLVIPLRKPAFMAIDAQAFPHTPSGFFWTASANDTAVAAVFFDMSTYPTGLGPKKTLGNVRCVRGTLRASYKVPESASYNLMTIARSAAH